MRKNISNAKIIASHSISLDQSYEFLVNKAAKCNILLIGEIHYQTKMDYFIASMLPKLKKMGYDYYVMEEQTSLQPFVDKYLKGQITLEKLQRKGFLDTCDVVFEACKKLGIKVIFCDSRRSKYLDHLPSGFKQQTEKERFDYIYSVVPKDAKMIVHCGAAHTSYNYEKFSDPDDGMTIPTIGQLFKKEFGDKAYSVFFTDEAVGSTSGLNVWKKEGGIKTKYFGDRVFQHRDGVLAYFKDWEFIVNIEFDGKYQLPKTAFFH